MLKNPNYSKEEDKVILENINLYPNNLQHSFEVSATLLNRTPKAIQFRYYNQLRDKNTEISVVSKKGVITRNNQKNAIRELPYTDKEGNLKIKLLTSMANSLSKKDKVILIEHLFNNLKF